MQKLMQKVLGSLFVLLSSLFFFTPLAFAHVVVKPSNVGIGSFQTFDTSVPNEKDNPAVAVKLLIPDGLKEVSPTVKSGWTIDIKKNGDQVTEIDWTGGSIPAGQRDDFTFSAQAPSSATTLKWKAYQTYSDGTVISWDQEPKPGSSDDDSVTPYSTTQVINDLTPTTAQTNSSPQKDNSALVLSVVAILISAVALGLNIRRQA